MTRLTKAQKASLKSKRYPAIWAWGWCWRSFDYWMESQEAKAIAADAPKGAFGQVGGFGKDAEQWHVWQADIANPTALDYMRDALAGIE
jgi:hypothetical protein